MESGKRILFEGANGAMLDVDHGTYPFVTSSSTGPWGVAAGAGVPPGCTRHRLGVTKAYCTRVGSGPFPTELTNETGVRIRERGREFGTTTGRPRRCGWFDAVIVRRTVFLGGITEIAVMHLDTLAGFDEVQICTGYRLGERTLQCPPPDAETFDQAIPIFETMPGWSQDLRGIRTMAELPANARAYIQRLEDLVGAPVTMISVGPDRADTVFATDRDSVFRFLQPA
jgi:adenylosuccinate synthase